MSTHVEREGDDARPGASIKLRWADRAQRGHSGRIHQQRGTDVWPRLPLPDESPPPDWADEDRAMRGERPWQPWP